MCIIIFTVGPERRLSVFDGLLKSVLRLLDALPQSRLSVYDALPQSKLSVLDRPLLLMLIVSLPLYGMLPIM